MGINFHTKKEVRKIIKQEKEDFGKKVSHKYFQGKWNVYSQGKNSLNISQFVVKKELRANPELFLQFTSPEAWNIAKMEEQSIQVKKV